MHCILVLFLIFPVDEFCILRLVLTIQLFCLALKELPLRLAQALKVKTVVNSPTFVIMKIYIANHPKIKTLVHVDAYRLSSSEELKDIGLAEYLNQEKTVVVIEWADRVKNILPKNTLFFKFTEGQNENQRLVTKA